MRLLFIAFSCSLLASCHVLDTREVSEIRGVTIIDAVNGIRENHTVVFADDEILRIFPTDESSISPNVIDGSGKYLIPGLWDFHVHLTSKCFFRFILGVADYSLWLENQYFNSPYSSLDFHGDPPP